ncbi:Lrp/AsnC family transcriptional regulator [Taklimakanibacter lacteus]|uniref:Lrp/AsnC family transcriptional regulator n=1 Tax=Taklimakanibacter lacteus TaxID=2268456 RepID=UPI000E663FF6
MDEFDRKILNALQRDSAAGRADLARQVGLSESQVVRRRQALEQSGAIRRYRADLDARALGLAVTAFVHVKLKGHSDGNARRFRDLVRLTPGILEAHAVTGDFDYLLKICVADLDALRDLVNGVLLMHATVDRVRSEIVLEILRDDQLLVL